MFLARLGSLNAIEQTRQRPFWRSWLEGDLPSADSLGRVAALMDLDSIRHKVDALVAMCQDACRAPHDEPANNSGT